MEKIAAAGLQGTSNMLFDKARGKKNNEEMPQFNNQFNKPFQIDLKTTDKGEVEKIGGSAKLGDFSIGGSVNPGFTQTVGGFMGDQDIRIPTTYNVGATYSKGPFKFNYQHGTRGYSGGANVNMTF